LAVHNLTYLTTSDVYKKFDTSAAPIKTDFTQAKSMEIRKSYGDSFNDDLFELYGFTVAFSKDIEVLTSLITILNAIPQK
jgi:hypothetical protein